jgi:hypothetical protein
VYGKSGHLYTIGQALKDGLNEMGVKVIGQPERSILSFPSEDERLEWCRKMIGQNVMCDRPFFPTLVHTMADVETTLKAAEAIRERA